MWCIAYALGRSPNIAEIHRARVELSVVSPKSVNKIIMSTEMLLPYMTDREIDLFKKQICTCMLGAADYRISLQVQDRCSTGYLCPRCRIPLDRDYQSYCDRCGQHLNWNGCL